MEIFQALKFAELKHRGQTRLGDNEPYINHPVAVSAILAEKGYNSDEYMVAALFHDLLEDTDATEEEILALSSQEVLDIVKCVTKVDGYVMQDYMDRIKAVKKAKNLKLADRLHNIRSAIRANKKFKIKYAKETRDWYLDLAKGTVFEEDILQALKIVEDSI